MVRPLGRELRLRLGAVLPALEAAGFPTDHPAMRRAVAWLEDTRTRTAASARTAAPTTAAKPACLARAASRRPRRPRGRSSGSSPPEKPGPNAPPVPSAGSPARRSATAAGTRPFFTGTGFPRDFLINYHLYREVWPVMALGRVRRFRCLTGSASLADDAYVRRITTLALARTGGRGRSPRRACADAPAACGSRQGIVAKVYVTGATVCGATRPVRDRRRRGSRRADRPARPRRTRARN